jgi:protein involved in polysaccharide export with SLBB domain
MSQGSILVVIVALVSGCTLLGACVEQGIPMIPDEPSLLEPTPDYLVRRGDLLSIKFFYTPELNEDVTVRPDGRISLQLVGEVVAVDRTPGELSESLEQSYAAVLSKPDVVVIVREFAGHRAYIGGEVTRPTMVSLDGETTVADAIFEAGGSKLTAALSSVILVRNGENGREAYRVDLSDGFRARAPVPVLRPYDLVYVPKSFVAKVGDFVDLYINRIVPRNASFTAIYEIKDQWSP